jgi:hypothetical protein
MPGLVAGLNRPEAALSVSCPRAAARHACSRGCCWQAQKADGYRWWAQRISRSLELYDETRIDHFRGFAGAPGWGDAASLRIAGLQHRPICTACCCLVHRQ